MKGISSIAFATNKTFQWFNKMCCISSIYCNNWVTGRVRSKIDLVITKEDRKSKEVINLWNEVAFVDLSWLHTWPIFKLISSRQNTIGAKRLSKSSNLVTFSTHRVGKKSDNLFFWKSGAYLGGDYGSAYILLYC